MKTRVALPLFLSSFGLLGLAGCRTCVHFEPPLTIGTRYEPPSNNAGDVVFTTAGIPVSVQKFVLSNGTEAFNFARIEAAPSGFGYGQVIQTNNMNLEFDFSKLGFLTKRVELQFRDIGGHENLSVNGSQLFVGELTAAPTTVQGIVITVSASPISGGKQGKLVLTGKISNLRIGGQEFFLDNVCYVK